MLFFLIYNNKAYSQGWCVSPGYKDDVKVFGAMDMSSEHESTESKFHL